MALLSHKTLEKMITDDVEWFKEKIERNELIDKILISPFTEEEREYLEAASFDLRVGGKFVSVTHDRSGEISEKKPLLIKPGETVRILSYEYIGLPQSVAACVTSKLSLSMLGLSQLSTRIDPGFYGKITEVVTNLSNREIELTYKQPFCTLLFLKVDHPSPDQRYKGDYRGKNDIRPTGKLRNPSPERPVTHAELKEIFAFPQGKRRILYDGFIGILSLLSFVCLFSTVTGFFSLPLGALLSIASLTSLFLFLITR